MERTISKLVLLARETPGWLTIIEKLAGKEIALQCEKYDDALIAGEVLCERYYYEVERQKVREDLQIWEAEMKEFSEMCRKRRTQELNDILAESKTKLADILTHRGDLERKVSLLADIKKMEKIIKNDISPEKIERAKEYPLEQLLEIQNGMAKCINHDDSTPSMNCKKNFAYCHACGFHADPIGVYMKLKNCNFVEAVNTLSL